MMRPSSGVLVAVVGPSGAGKDSLIRIAQRELANDQRFAFPYRVITRPADDTEPCKSIDEVGFRKLSAAGGFALQWEAHGLSYGIPASVEADLARGSTVIVNVSRSVLSGLSQRFPQTRIVHVTAAPEVLAARLAQRGREELASQRARLLRAQASNLPVEASITIVNDGAIEVAGRQFVNALLDIAAPLDMMLGP